MSSVGQYDNSTLVGNWLEDRLHRKAAEPRGEQLHHIHRYRATPIAMEPASGSPPPPPACSHASEQYGRKQLVQPQPRISFADTATLHSAIERPSQRDVQQTAVMQRSGVLPAFTRQQTDKRELSLSSHSSYGGQYADSAERRAMLPLVDWEEKEALAAAAHCNSTSRNGTSSGSSLTGNNSSSPSDAQRGTGKHCSGASGERLQVGGDVDPALHSFVQRSWLPHRQHFDHYCAERVDVWKTNADRDRVREEQSRLTRRGEMDNAVEGERSKRNSSLTTARAVNSQFDRTVHAFTTSPTFQPIH